MKPSKRSCITLFSESRSPTDTAIIDLYGDTVFCEHSPVPSVGTSISCSEQKHKGIVVFHSLSLSSSVSGNQTLSCTCEMLYTDVTSLKGRVCCPKVCKFDTRQTPDLDSAGTKSPRTSRGKSQRRSARRRLGMNTLHFQFLLVSLRGSCDRCGVAKKEPWLLQQPVGGCHKANSAY